MSNTVLVTRTHWRIMAYVWPLFFVLFGVAYIGLAMRAPYVTVTVECTHETTLLPTKATVANEDPWDWDDDDTPSDCPCGDPFCVGH